MKRGEPAGRDGGAGTDGVRRILVVKMSSLGDLFHALPAVHNLRLASRAPVDWVVHPEYADLARCFEDADRVIVFPRRGGPGGAWRYLREVRRERYDLVVDLQGLLKSLAAARLARSRRVIGPSFCREGTRGLYSAVAGPRDKERHAVEENLDVIRYLGWEEIDPVFPVRFPPADIRGPAPHIALVPRSRWATKNWPVEAFAALGRRLLDRTPGTLHLVGSAADAAAVEAIERGIGGGGRVDNRCGRTTLVETGSLLAAMDLVVTVDSGPMHVAAALGRPVLALFGPTDPVRTGPYGEGHRVLRVESTSCSPCFEASCRRGDLACLRNLFPSEVAEAALELLREAAGRERERAAAAPAAPARAVQPGLPFG